MRCVCGRIHMSLPCTSMSKKAVEPGSLAAIGRICAAASGLLRAVVRGADKFHTGPYLGSQVGTHFFASCFSRLLAEPGDFACTCISDLAIIYSLFRMAPATQAGFKVLRKEGDINAGVGLRTNLGSCAKWWRGNFRANQHVDPLHRDVCDLLFPAHSPSAEETTRSPPDATKSQAR